MPLAIIWTPFLDGELRRMRASGVAWDSIARSFGMSRNTALERGRHLGFGRSGGAMPLAAAQPWATAQTDAASPDTAGADDARQSEDGRADGGLVQNGVAENGHAQDGQAQDGQAEDGQAQDGQAGTIAGRIPAPPPRPKKGRAGDSPALRAGDPVTWGAITDGTLLDGVAYPPWTLRILAAGEAAAARGVFAAIRAARAAGSC